MSRRIKIDRNGQPVRNSYGDIIRTKPNTRTGAMLVPNEPEMYFQSEIHGEILKKIITDAS